MGMYDLIELDVSCPICGNAIINTFQTKDFDCLMDVYQPGDEVPVNIYSRVVRAYTTCDHKREITKIEGELIFTLITGYWIEYEIPIIDGVITRDQNLWKRKIEPVAYNGLSVVPDGYTEEEIYLMVEKLNEKMKKDINTMKAEKMLKGEE
jgi:hypothetical protein